MHGKKILLLDRDTKFTLKFREHLKAAGTEPIRLPPKSQNCNAFIERFFRSIKTECLRKMILFGEGSLRSTVEKYVNYYHRHRNHQGNNLRIAPTPEEPITGTIDTCSVAISFKDSSVVPNQLSR
jgi:putative transposase